MGKNDYKLSDSDLGVLKSVPRGGPPDVKEKECLEVAILILGGAMLFVGGLVGISWWMLA